MQMVGLGFNKQKNETKNDRNKRTEQGDSGSQ